MVTAQQADAELAFRAVALAALELILATDSVACHQRDDVASQSRLATPP